MMRPSQGEKPRNDGFGSANLKRPLRSTADVGPGRPERGQFCAVMNALFTYS
jgi:hypothetical protein